MRTEEKPKTAAYHAPKLRAPWYSRRVVKIAGAGLALGISFLAGAVHNAVGARKHYDYGSKLQARCAARFVELGVATGATLSLRSSEISRGEPGDKGKLLGFVKSIRQIRRDTERVCNEAEIGTALFVDAALSQSVKALAEYDPTSPDLQALIDAALDQ